MTRSSLTEKQWLMLCHASAFSGFIIPFGNVIGPLMIYLLKKDTSPLIADQSKESLNFQLTITIGIVISFILMILFIGFLLLAALVIINVVLIIIAIVKTDEGVLFRYPYKIRFF